MLEPLHRQLREILRRCVADGAFRPDIVSEDVSELLFHMIGSGRRRLHMGRDPGHVADTVAALVLRAVST